MFYLLEKKINNGIKYFQWMILTLITQSFQLSIFHTYILVKPNYMLMLVSFFFEEKNISQGYEPHFHNYTNEPEFCNAFNHEISS